jgi:predicted DCC family thiol-disulfide oxidoreductase YuxK
MRAPTHQPARLPGTRHGEDQHVLVFDGGCGYCRNWVNRVQQWDRNGSLEFLPFQAPGVRERFPWIPEGAYSDAVQLVAPNGATWEGAGAVEKLLTLLPGGRPLALLFRIPTARRAADAVYRWVAAHRATAACDLPP